MADIKKYYWLKLMKDFFTQPKIKKLRRIAGGDTYTIIYLKLQLLSIDNNAVLEYQEIENDFIEEMALTIDEDVENVKVTINYLIAQGMMEKVDDHHYILVETLKSIGSETSKAELMRKKRGIEKEIVKNGNNVTKVLPTVTNALPTRYQSVTDVLPSVTNCYTEIEKEKELDKELELKKELESDKKKDKRETYVSILDSYTSNDSLKSSLNDFVEMRKKMKGFTTRAFKLALNKLDELSNDDNEKIKIVNQSVMNSWKSFYELKDETNKYPSWYKEGTQEETEEDKIKNLEKAYLATIKLKNMGMISENEFKERETNYRKSYYDLTGKYLNGYGEYDI